MNNNDRDYICCLECVDCYEEFDFSFKHYECYEANDCCCKVSCFSLVLSLKYFLFILNLSFVIGLLNFDILLFINELSLQILIDDKDRLIADKDLEFDKINTFILIPLFSILYLFFSFQMTFFYRDGLFFIISGIFLNIFQIIKWVTRYYNELKFYISFQILEVSSYLLLIVADYRTACSQKIKSENKKTKYLRWYSICYFLFCVCAIFIYINAKYFYPKNYSFNNEIIIKSKYYHLSYIIAFLPIIILFFHLICKKSENFCFTISILISEVLSLISKIVIIFLPYSSANKFPAIIILEIIFFIIDLFLNINLFKDEITNCIYKIKGETLRKKIKLIFFFEAINNDNNGLINKEQSYDEELKEIEINSNIKNKFKDDINNLKIEMKRISEIYIIKSIIFSDTTLYSENIPLDNRTNEELNILNDSRIKVILNLFEINFIFISYEDGESQNILTNIIAKIKKRVGGDELLYNIVNKIKDSKKNINFCNLDKIYGKKDGDKIFLENKKFKDLNLEEINYTIYIPDYMFMKLIWISMDDEEFQIGIKKFEKFHDVISAFIKYYNNKLKFYIITEIYILMEKDELARVKTTIDENKNNIINNKNNNIRNNDNNNNIKNDNNNIINNDNNNIINNDSSNNNIINNDNNNMNNKHLIIPYSNIDTNREPLKKKVCKPPERNNVSKKEKKIIENEYNYEYKTFEELNLYNNFEIYFKTRNTREQNEDEKKKSEKQKFEIYGPKINNKQYLIFKSNQAEYPLFIDQDLKIKDALLLFKKEYYSFIDVEINCILLKGENILASSKTIKQLKLNENTPLLFYFNDDDISEII